MRGATAARSASKREMRGAGIGSSWPVARETDASAGADAAAAWDAVARMPGGRSSATGWLRRSDSERPHATSAIDGLGREDAVRDAQQLEQGGGDLAHQQVLGRVLAASPRQVTSSSAGARTSV